MRCEPIHKLDRWWVDLSPRRRMDRNAGNLCMLIGLMLPTMSIILQGPVPNSPVADMPETLQVAMCGAIFVGCGTKLHGAMAGSRWWFPRTSLAKSYRWGVTGAPLATAGCWVYGWFILSGTETVWSALSGIATPMFGLGISIQAGFYWLESRRIDNAERILKRQAVNEILANGHSDDADS